MKKIKWGIIGPGRIAQQFAHDMPLANYAECVAVASRTLSRAEEFAQQYNIPKAYGSYAELLDDETIDIVYVAVPHPFHHDVVTQILNKKKAVLCEKPMVINMTECESLCGLAKAQGQYLMEGMWTYFLPSVIKAKQWVDEGLIGDVKHIKCDFGWVQPQNLDDRWYNPDLAGGVMYDMGCYNLALTHLFAGKEPEKMNVLCRKADNGVDKEVTMMFEYDTMDATLMTSFECKYPNKGIIIGDKGYVVIDDFWRSKSCQLYDNDGLVRSFDDANTGFGFNFEIDAVSQDLMKGLLQSETVSHAYSKTIMKQMEDIMSQF